MPKTLPNNAPEMSPLGRTLPGSSGRALSHRPHRALDACLGLELEAGVRRNPRGAPWSATRRRLPPGSSPIGPGLPSTPTRHSRNQTPVDGKIFVVLSKTSRVRDYSPELNPIEYLWGCIKANPLANLAIPDIDELADMARSHARSLQHRSDLLKSFVRHSPLSLRLVCWRTNRLKLYAYRRLCTNSGAGTLDFGENLLACRVPSIRLRSLVALDQIELDLLDQLPDATETASTNHIARQISEEPFDQIHP